MAEIKGRRWFAEQADGNEMYLLAINKTIAKARTAFQDVEIVDTPSYGTMLILDGMIQSSEDDEATYHEALVHPGMIAHEDPHEVLIIGGGEGATLREVLRHRSVRRATMVDIDGELLELCKEHLEDWHQDSFDDPRAELHISDGRAFLESTERTFDVVICDIVDLLDHGPAMKLYTAEFYRLIAERLNPGGILVVQALETSISDWEEHAMLARTVGESFPIVRSYTAFIPSFIYSWGFLVASSNVDPSALTKDEVDARLDSRLSSPLRSYDGITHQGLFSLAKDLRVLLMSPGKILEDANIDTWDEGLYAEDPREETEPSGAAPVPSETNP